MVFGALVVGRTAVFSSDYTKAKLAAFNIFKLIDSKPAQKTKGQVTKPPTGRAEGNLDFSEVHFSYPSRPETEVLSELSFSAKKGETVALVGTSGCGKSTTVQLLEQFYECSKGKI
ncbi:PREDICTED: ATP-binding cassette sub-family B member 5-like, partial [Rhagoletis zephyria]|uniref:ATP-binding cassette sub-family B member 5-like n=1 Tax=Rhagoletis zephyria TaxID=28612 RepID=UPI0008118C4C